MRFFIENSLNIKLKTNKTGRENIILKILANNNKNCSAKLKISIFLWGINRYDSNITFDLSKL